MRKIGELKGKPIIEGNPNEIKKNQIHYKESDGGITLSERKEDNTFSSVTSGSGSGEGVKEYYYKFKDEYLDTNIHNISIMGDIPILHLLHGILIIDAIICPIYTDDGGWHSVGNIELEGTYVISHKIKANPYFKIIDSNIYLPGGYQDDNTIESNFIISRIGNIENRIIKAAHLLGGKEAAMESLQVINDIVQEITKEEYEAMITYKPE